VVRVGAGPERRDAPERRNPMIIALDTLPNLLAGHPDRCRDCDGLGLRRCGCVGYSLLHCDGEDDCERCQGVGIVACPRCDRWLLRWRPVGGRWACIVCGRLADERTETCTDASYLYPVGDPREEPVRLVCGRESYLPAVVEGVAP
jgi:hypothetical protein